MPPILLKRRALLAALANLPAWARAATAHPVPPPLMLALEAASDVDPAGFLVSEKYDGVRAHWDGRALRFRSGLPVPVPAWFTGRLPPLPLDGELWLGCGRFETLVGAVRRQPADDAAWRQLRYMVFDLPGGEGPFAARARRIQALVQATQWTQMVAVQQTMVGSRQALLQQLDEVVRAGGEGLMLHRADANWHNGRSRDLLKLKPLQDAEAQVIGHVGGHGRHVGRLGALQVRTPQGVVFLIGTGFSDAQRQSPPGLGAVVSYTHRGFTEHGVPRFASFLCVHAG